MRREHVDGFDRPLLILSTFSCLHDLWTVRFNVILLPMLRSVNVSYRMYCLHGVATLSAVGPAH